MRSLPLLSLTILLGVAPLTAHVEATESRELRFPPLKDRRLVLSVDTHAHSVCSDGHVWPTVRVWEANKDRLDTMAITEHLEYQPYREDVPHPDRNRAFELAVKENKQGRERTDLLLIPGAEITRKYAPGHVNALFIEDTNPLLTVKHRREENFDTARKALKAVTAQQGFMIWNHPAWPRDFPDGVIKLSKEQPSLFDEGLIQGIEVANGEYFNDSSLQARFWSHHSISSMWSLPKNCSSPTKKAGMPKTPRSTAPCVFAMSSAFTSGSCVASNNA